MDNLTHSLVAASLGRVGLSEKVPGGTLSLIVAANLADSDVISGFWGELYYLAYHRGISHSIAGALTLAALLTGLLWLIGRVRGHPASLGQISLAVFLAAASHPLLDLTNAYGLRPFLPFRDHWYYGDLVFIVDPYLWLVLGGAVFLTAKRGSLGNTGWLIGATLTSIVMILGAFGYGLWIPLGIWLAGVGVVIILKTRRGVFPASLAAGALGAVVVYWAFLGAIHWATLREVYPEVQALYPGIGREAVSATPRPANPFVWDVFVETPSQIACVQASSFSMQSLRFEAFPRNDENPDATAAASTCAGAVFTHFARFPVFGVAQTNHGPVVTIEDLRFSRQGGARGRHFGTVTIRLDSPGELPCPKNCTGLENRPDLQTNRDIHQRGKMLGASSQTTPGLLSTPSPRGSSW